MAGKGITIQIQGDGAGAAEALRLIEERMQQTADRGTSMSEQLALAGETIKSAFEMIGVGIGIREAIDGLKEMTAKSIDLGMEIGHMVQQTGISAQTLSVLRYTAQQTGIDFEVLSKGFKKMSTDIFEWEHGQKIAGEAFKDLGISLKDVQAKGQDMYGILEMIANRFQQMPDGPHKLAIAVELFGRAGQQMIPILNQGAAGLDAFKSQAESLGLVLDEAGVKKMEELHAQVTELKGVFEGLGLELTSDLAPALEKIGQLIPQVFGFGGQGTHGNDFAAGIDAMARGLRGLVRDLSEAGLLMDGDIAGAQRLEAQWAQEERARYDAQHRNPSVVDNTMTFLRSGNGGEHIPPPDDEAGSATGSVEPLDAHSLKLAQAAAAKRMAALVGSLPASAQAAGAIMKADADDAAKLEQQAYEKATADQQKVLLEVFNSKPPSVQLNTDASMHLDNTPKDLGANSKENKLNVEVARQAAQTIGGFMDQLSEQTLRGKANFKSLVDSAIMDLERFAMKVIEERSLIPALNSLFGVQAPYNPASGPPTASTGIFNGLFNGADANGGDIDTGWAIVGDGGDGSGSELFAPKGPGTVLPHDVLQGIASMKGGGGGAPNVTINNVNNSSSQVKMSQAGASWDAGAKQFVIHTILEDMEQGGPMSAAMAGFAPK